MSGFDDYLNRVIGGLKISGKRKMEIMEEYRGHLEQLKKDHAGRGMDEEAAVEQAIKDFGDVERLKKVLRNAYPAYRNAPVIIFGIILFLLYLIFFYLPIYGWVYATIDYKGHGQNIYYYQFAAVIKYFSSNFWHGDILILSIALLPYGFIPAGFLRFTAAKQTCISDTVILRQLPGRTAPLFLSIRLKTPLCRRCLSHPCSRS